MPRMPAHLSVGDGTPTALFDVFRPSYHTVLLFNLPAEETERVLCETKKKFPQSLVKTVTIDSQGSSDGKTAGQ